MSDADTSALVAMLRQIQCEPASFDTYSMASAAERAADAIERLSLSATAGEKLLRRIGKADGYSLGESRIALYDTEFDPQNWLDERDQFIKGRT